MPIDNILGKTMYVLDKEDVEHLRDLLKHIRKLIDLLEKAFEED